MKTCSRCGTIKPADAYLHRSGPSRNDGLKSWCDTCVAESKRIWRRDALESNRARKLLDRQHIDPTEFSRLHCIHVARYLARQIDLFEAKTEQEAPPYLTAIHHLALDMIAKHPAQQNPRILRYEPLTDGGTRPCVVCGTEFSPKRGGNHAKYCSSKCKERIKSRRRRAVRPIT